MKRIYLMIIVALLTSVSVSAKGKKQLVILHTNDTHSTVMPLNGMFHTAFFHRASA